MPDENSPPDDNIFYNMVNVYGPIPFILIVVAFSLLIYFYYKKDIEPNQKAEQKPGSDIGPVLFIAAALIINDFISYDAFTHNMVMWGLVGALTGSIIRMFNNEKKHRDEELLDEVKKLRQEIKKQNDDD